MRSRIIVISRDAAPRARLAQLLARSGYHAQVAESVAHARRAGLDGIALAILAPSGFGPEQAAAVEELRAAVGRVLIVAPSDAPGASSDFIDPSDEAGLLVGISRTLAPKPQQETAEPTIEFEGYRLDLGGHSLTNPAGKQVPLRPAEFSLLRALAQRSGRVLSRDQLLQLTAGRDAEPYERSVDMQIMRLRRKIEPDPERPILIVTVPGSGYKFAAPAREAVPAEHTTKHAKVIPRADTADKSGRPHLSIVVLPFANIGGDPEQEYFADGVTDSLTTDLSRISGAFVIGRSTAFTYKGKAGDVRQIGHELNVRYVLEGSVQRGGKRLRVNVQLLEAETASHIWAERFDKPVADLFDMQDEIVSRLANALGQELEGAEARRAERAANPDSMDHYFLGRALAQKGHTVAILDKARFHYDRALELDPDNVDALVGRARTDLALVMSWLSEERRDRLLSAEAYVAKALELCPNCAAAHCALGALRIHGYRAAQGIAECERALAIDQNLAAAHAYIGMAKVFSGRSEETEAHILEALRISPRDALAWAWMNYVGIAKFHLGRDEEALAWLSRSIELSPNSPVAWFCLAATLAHLDRVEEAREAARACLEINPSFTIARFRSQTFSDHPVYLAGRERMYEGLRKAGMPEG
jgi:TolB-like protein/DNA-binding response OmpR family regulator